ncbi:MAG TPA: helix-turn-helix domain-containing protein [Candidatus Nanoarchaeia archaeon]|nr:helix-turn-helix domain-containing protein [Candidatus Nanoarchaeia archaeon]
MKSLKVGVYHHDCWGSFSTKDYPTISMSEMGAVKIVDRSRKGVLVDSFFRITADSVRELDRYLSYVKSLPSLKQVKVHYRKDNRAYVFIQFLSTSSSYDQVLRSKAMPMGPIVQEKELEIHTVATENPGQTTKLLRNLEQLGEVKVFRIADFDEGDVFAHLTGKQQDALLHAFNNNYYDWPRKKSLDMLAKQLGLKRRTFQERLRQAEAKFIPRAIEDQLKKH